MTSLIAPLPFDWATFQDWTLTMAEILAWPVATVVSVWLIARMVTRIVWISYEDDDE